MSLYVGPDGTQRLGDILREEFIRPWTRVRFATAYVKMSGLDHVHDLLETFASAPGHVLQAIIGIDQHGTSYEGLAALLQIFDPHGHEVCVCHNPRSKAFAANPTFHPKMWLFDEGVRAKLLVGSGNLTQGGLYTNHEMGAVQVLDLEQPADKAVFDEAVATLTRWADPNRGDVRRLTSSLLEALYKANLVLSEDEMRRASRVSARTRVLAGRGGTAASVGDSVFDGEEFPDPPLPPGGRRDRLPPPARDEHETPGEAPAVLARNRTFFILLSKAAKTEIYLAQAPLREDSAFFGLPFTGRTDPRAPGNPPQPQASPWPRCDVTIYDATGIAGASQDLPTKMWQYMEGPHANKDVRIYFTAELQRLIDEGSVLVMQRDPRPGIDYAVSIYSPSHPEFAKHSAKCSEPLPNSSRRYGWS